MSKLLPILKEMLTLLPFGKKKDNLAALIHTLENTPSTTRANPLRTLKGAINEGYLLTDRKEAANLSFLISILEKEIPLSAVEKITHLKELSQVRQILTRKPLDPIYYHFYNELSKVFNNALDALEEQNHGILTRFNRLPSTTEVLNKLLIETDNEKISDALTYRISLVESYKQLYSRYSSELYLEVKHSGHEDHHPISLSDYDNNEETDTAKAKIFASYTFLKINKADLQSIYLFKTQHLDPLEKKAHHPHSENELKAIYAEVLQAQQKLNSIAVNPADQTSALIYKRFKKEFNHILQNLNQHNSNYFQLAGIKKLVLPFDEKDTTTDAYQPRLNLLETDGQLLADFSSKDLKEEKISSYIQKDSAFHHIYRVIKTHPNHYYASEGLRIIANENTQLTSQISLKQALRLIWEAIPKQDADKAKKALYDNLTKIGRDLIAIRTTHDQETALGLLLEVLANINDPHVTILKKPHDIVTLIEKKCHDKLQGHLESETLSEQSKILYHLEKHEGAKEHLVFNNYVEETSELLLDEFSIYSMALDSIPIMIKAFVDNCTSEISKEWLREHTKKGLAEKLNASNEPNTIKETLLKLLDIEIQSGKNPDRIALFTTLADKTKSLIPTSNGTTYKSEVIELENMEDRYDNILRLDKYHAELHDIIKQQLKPENRFLYLPIKQTAENLLKQFSYREFIRKPDEYRLETDALIKHHVTKIKTKQGELWINYHSSVQSRIERLKSEVDHLKSLKKDIDLTLSEGIKKENLIYTQQFSYPESYDGFNKGGIAKKISDIFKDYADKAHWYYFHSGRTHVKEARYLESIIKECKNPETIREHLIAVKNALIAKGKLNLTGSLSRRIHYCLEKILPQPAQSPSQGSSIHLSYSGAHKR
jgi:hypothetical protein